MAKFRGGGMRVSGGMGSGITKCLLCAMDFHICSLVVFNVIIMTSLRGMCGHPILDKKGNRLIVSN